MGHEYEVYQGGRDYSLRKDKYIRLAGNTPVGDMSCDDHQFPSPPPTSPPTPPPPPTSPPSPPVPPYAPPTVPAPPATPGNCEFVSLR